MKRILIAIVCMAVASTAWAKWPHGGVAGGGNPLSLPLAQASNADVTFLGSFLLPTGTAQGILYGGHAMSVSGSTLYVASNYYDPADTNNLVTGGGIAAVTIPELSGTPAYDGSNGTATSIYGPQRQVTYVAPANYTASSAPATGATSVLMDSLPAGIAANAGWYAEFSGSNSPDELITGVSADTISWASGLTGSGYSTTVSIHQWEPAYPWGQASGDEMTGSVVYNDTLYLTGGTYYDGSCDQQLGWIISANPTTGGDWGAVNTVSGQTAQYSRRYAGVLGAVPSAWQSLLGGPVFEAGGMGLSVLSCNLLSAHLRGHFRPISPRPC